MAYSDQFRSPISLFFIRFVIWLLPLHLLIWSVNQVPLTRSITLNSISWAAAKLYSLAGGELLLAENLLVHLENGRYLIIDQSCSGLGLSVTLIAGLLAFKCKRFDYIILTLLVVQLLNQLRITHLFHLIRDDMLRFNFYHLYVWQAVNFMFACLFFSVLLWSESKHACP